MDRLLAGGLPYSAALAQPELAAMAAGREWTLPVIERNWSLATGAFGKAAGPT